MYLICNELEFNCMNVITVSQSFKNGKISVSQNNLQNVIAYPTDPHRFIVPQINQI